MNQKKIFAKNLQYYMDMYCKTRKDVCNDLDINYNTFCDWINAKKYPRINKVERLAIYFHVKISDLIEDNDTDTKLSKREVKHITTYRKLSDNGKGIVDDFTEFELEKEKRNEKP